MILFNDDSESEYFWFCFIRKQKIKIEQRRIFNVFTLYGETFVVFWKRPLHGQGHFQVIESRSGLSVRDPLYGSDWKRERKRAIKLIIKKGKEDLREKILSGINHIEFMKKH